MSQEPTNESTKELLENAIRNAGTTATEVTTWVTELKTFHKEEARRWELRQRNLDTLEARFNSHADTLYEAHQLLVRERQALAQERAAFAGERAELHRTQEALEQVRVRLHEEISERHPDVLTRLFAGFLGGLFALGLAEVVRVWAPLLVRWVRGLFG